MIRRYRQCPYCGAIRAASAFVATGRNRPGYGERQRGRKCPHCGRTGATWVFRVVSWPDKGTIVGGVLTLNGPSEPPPEKPPAPDKRLWEDDQPKRRAEPRHHGSKQ